MKIKMKDLVSFHQNSDVFSDKTLPLKGAFKINRLKRDIENDFSFYQDKFKEILEKYADKDEEGNIKFSNDGSQILIKEGQIDECTEELENLDSMEVEVDNYDFNIDELGDIDCTPEELEILMPFLS